MAKAIFHKDFRFDRPGSPHCFDVKKSAEPQSRPRDVIDAAVAAGAATRIDGPKAGKPARKGRKSVG